MIATLCGSVLFPVETNFSMTLSNFTPNPNGAGGSIAISLNGQVIATWNVLDAKGNLVPNGYYHFVVLESPTGGNAVSLARDAFVAPYHSETVALAAMPNIGRAGDTIRFTASFAGTPADGQSKILLYSINGEWIRTLAIAPGGTASWDLDNRFGQKVASGVYLAVLDGVDPSGGQKMHRVVKILVTH